MNDSMTDQQVIALTDRAYSRIGGCGCPTVAELCVNCELLRDMISALAYAYPEALTDDYHRQTP